MIHFTWAGVNYVVADEAESKTHIVLPNGVVLKPDRWLETSPPQLGRGTVQVNHPLLWADLQEIADHVGDAVIAEVRR